MRKIDESDNFEKNSELLISAEGLMGKQSVRATFRLPRHVIELLGLVAAQLGLKQKSLFDQLIEDAFVLNKVAENAHDYNPESGDRRQKTFVLSKRSLQILNLVAQKQRIPRDVLVEVSIQRLLPVMNAEQEKHKKRMGVYEDLQNYLQQGRKLLQKTSRLLGKEDHVYEMVKKIVELCEEKVVVLEGIVEKGQSMENFEERRGS